MTRDVIQRQAGSVGEILQAAREIRRTWEPNPGAAEEVWYRGQARLDFALLPKLYRLPTFDEESALNVFRSLAVTLTPQAVASDWDWYYLARHHGLPSRLLDWSESLTLGLFFALEARWPRSRREHEVALGLPPAVPSYGTDSPVIWVLDAGSLNQASSGEDSTFVPGGPFTNQYLPGSPKLVEGAEDCALPIALLPNRSNARIVAQQGMFTLHGHDRRALDEIARAAPEIRLGRIVLDVARIPTMIEELQVLGVTRHGVYPDLDAVAAHVAWMYEPGATAAGFGA